MCDISLICSDAHTNTTNTRQQVETSAARTAARLLARRNSIDSPRSAKPPAADREMLALKFQYDCEREKTGATAPCAECSTRPTTMIPLSSSTAAASASLANCLRCERRGSSSNKLNALISASSTASPLINCQFVVSSRGASGRKEPTRFKIARAITAPNARCCATTSFSSTPGSGSLAKNVGFNSAILNGERGSVLREDENAAACSLKRSAQMVHSHGLRVRMVRSRRQ